MGVEKNVREKGDPAKDAAADASNMIAGNAARNNGVIGWNFNADRLDQDGYLTLAAPKIFPDSSDSMHFAFKVAPEDVCQYDTIRYVRIYTLKTANGGCPALCTSIVPTKNIDALRIREAKDAGLP